MKMIVSYKVRISLKIRGENLKKFVWRRRILNILISLHPYETRRPLAARNSEKFTLKAERKIETFLWNSKCLVDSVFPSVYSLTYVLSFKTIPYFISIPHMTMFLFSFPTVFKFT